jgi:predicted AlkP superfamily phosphohydrolase/phosphomutase
MPVWTPTNWATLATGAHAGMHGMTRWDVDLGGGRRLDGVHGDRVNAERIWNARERAGLKSAIVHYPAARANTSMRH